MAFSKTLTILLLSLTMACANNDDDDSNSGNDNSGNNDSANDVLEVGDLVGTWEKTCESAGSVGFRRDSLVFDASTVQLIAELHQGDSACEGTSDLRAVAHFNYTVPAFDPAANSQVDLVLNSIRAQFNSNLAVTAANAANFCGYADWAVGVEKDVTGRNCIEELPGAGGNFFQIFHFENESRLFVGQVDSAHDGETAEERPVALEATPYTRVP